MRGQMIEIAVEMDDTALEAYLDGVEPDVDTLRSLIRKGTLAMKFVPVICGSAFKNKGVQPMLNAVVDFLPSPLDVPAYMGFKPGDETETRDIARSADDAQPFSALAFKIMNDPFVGSLTFTRIYSGSIKKGDQLLNSTKEKRERVGRMMMMHAINREEIDEAFAGDIIALAGLKDTTTGDTLCDPQKPVVLETMTFPEPVIEIAIEPKTKNDQEKMCSGPAAACRRGSELPGRDRHRERPDDHEGDGRAPSRHPGRPAEARVQGRGQHRRAAGGLPRDDLEEGRDRLYPQEADRRLGPVRADQARHRADPAGRGLSRSSRRSSAARCRRNTCRASRRASSR